MIRRSADNAMPELADAAVTATRGALRTIGDRLLYVLCTLLERRMLFDPNHNPPQTEIAAESPFLCSTESHSFVL